MHLHILSYFVAQLHAFAWNKLSHRRGIVRRAVLVKDFVKLSSDNNSQRNFRLIPDVTVTGQLL